jgi:hypothetical protein
MQQLLLELGGAGGSKVYQQELAWCWCKESTACGLRTANGGSDWSAVAWWKWMETLIP